MYYLFHNRTLCRANRADAVVQFIVYAPTVAQSRGAVGRMVRPVKRWVGKIYAR
jgi:hypothetical protein